MKKVYISATYKDLKKHREAVADALRKMRYEVHCMEDYVATDERTDVRCKQDVAECDFYVGIIALRYGWKPPGSQISITELEYNQARSQPNKTRCLLFLLDEKTARWPVRWIDAMNNPKAADKLRVFRGKLGGESTGKFATLDELVQQVTTAVHMEDLKTWKAALRQEFEKVLDHCRVKPVGAPEELGGTYKLYLSGSYKPMIVAVLQTAIRNANDAKLVGIDLSQQGGWWSTRLHLLAGLLADYTTVEKLVFSSNGGCLGTCGPAQVRRALANEIPSVEKAFAESLPGKRLLDPALDIPGIVERFSEKLDLMGGEEHMKGTNPPTLVQITANIVQNFPGFNPDRLPSPANQDKMLLLPEILRRAYPFVPLEEPGGTVVIDRVQLACRVAQLAIERV